MKARCQVDDEGIRALNTSNERWCHSLRPLLMDLIIPTKGTFALFPVETSRIRSGGPWSHPTTDPSLAGVNLRASNIEYRGPVQMYLREWLNRDCIPPKTSMEPSNGNYPFLSMPSQKQRSLPRLARQYNELGEALVESMSQKFQDKYGIAITDFIVERISLPPEVEKMMNKVTSMNMVGIWDGLHSFRLPMPLNPQRTILEAKLRWMLSSRLPWDNDGQRNGTKHEPIPTAPPPPPASNFHYNGAAGEGQPGVKISPIRFQPSKRCPQHLGQWMARLKSWKKFLRCDLVQVAPPPPPPPVEILYSITMVQKVKASPASQIATKVKNSQKPITSSEKEGLTDGNPLQRCLRFKPNSMQGAPPLPVPVVRQFPHKVSTNVTCLVHITCALATRLQRLVGRQSPSTSETQTVAGGIKGSGIGKKVCKSPAPVAWFPPLAVAASNRFHLVFKTIVRPCGSLSGEVA